MCRATQEASCRYRIKKRLLSCFTLPQCPGKRHGGCLLTSIPHCPALSHKDYPCLPKHLDINREERREVGRLHGKEIGEGKGELSHYLLHDVHGQIANSELNLLRHPSSP